MPARYTSKNRFPCIIFFDSHARGALPVRSYKGLAEQYGFVLIGSNISKNGMAWNANNEGIKALMKDARSRINIDNTRVYTAGFSGGSRVASSVAIMDGGIAGVIGCAAGFPATEQGPKSKFDYFGLVGDHDFNLAEMEQLDDALEENGFAHQLLTFSGIHGWPSEADFKTAMLWMQVSGMKEHLQPKNDILISALKNDLDSRTAVAKASGDWIKEHELLAGSIRILESLADVSAYKKQLASLDAGPDYKKALALYTQLQQQELNNQQELSKQFALQNEQWWAKKITELNQNAKSAKSKQEADMNTRLVNYLGLVGYMHSNHALNVGDLSNAASYLKIFKMADPQNPDCSYLSAIYYMKKGDAKQAINSLNIAVSLGYSDVTQLISDPAFASLHNDASFKDVVVKVRANYASK